jgi:hypothetical protein
MQTIKVSDDKKKVIITTTTEVAIEQYIIQQKRQLVMPKSQVDAINANLAIVEEAGIDVEAIKVPATPAIPGTLRTL